MFKIKRNATVKNKMGEVGNVIPFKGVTYLCYLRSWLRKMSWFFWILKILRIQFNKRKLWWETIKVYPPPLLPRMKQVFRSWPWYHGQKNLASNKKGHPCNLRRYLILRAIFITRYLIGLVNRNRLNGIKERTISMEPIMKSIIERPTFWRNASGTLSIE